MSVEIVARRRAFHASVQDASSRRPSRRRRFEDMPQQPYYPFSEAEFVKSCQLLRLSAMTRCRRRIPLYPKRSVYEWIILREER
jgi:hypothetical protein